MYWVGLIWILFWYDVEEIYIKGLKCVVFFCISWCVSIFCLKFMLWLEGINWIEVIMVVFGMKFVCVFVMLDIMIKVCYVVSLIGFCNFICGRIIFKYLFCLMDNENFVKCYLNYL